MLRYLIPLTAASLALVACSDADPVAEPLDADPAVNVTPAPAMPPVPAETAEAAPATGSEAPSAPERATQVPMPTPTGRAAPVADPASEPTPGATPAGDEHMMDHSGMDHGGN